MLTIGQFAQLTELTVKALRHYDSIGLLVPAATDPVSGYRLYAPEQAKDAATIAVLREVGLGLPAIADALRGDATAAVTSFVEERSRQRLAQDQVAAAAQALLQGYSTAPRARHRRVEKLDYVSLAVDMDHFDGKEESDEVDEAFNDLFRGLWEAGCEPLGHWWLRFDATSGDGVDMVWCIPVRTLPEPAVLDALGAVFPVTTGHDPAHDEAAVDLDPEPLTELELELPHPALVGLLSGGVEQVREVRQCFRLDEEGLHMEVVAVTDSPSA